LQNLLKVAKCHGLKPRSVVGKEKYESRISSTKASKAPRVKSLYICNDPTGAQVKERAKEHIQTSKLSHLIATSHYGVPSVVRSTIRFSRADHPRKVPRPGHSPMVLKAQIGGYNIGRVFMDAGSGINLIYARTLKAMCISLENLKPTDCSFHGIVPGAANYPLGKIELDICFDSSSNYRREKLEFEVMD
jgi:hypothetical protein